MNFTEYGFIDKQGKFYPVPWLEHYKFAREQNKEVDLEERLKSKYLIDDVDYLVHEKGWLLLHNPHQEKAILEQGKPMTRAQRQTLYEYYQTFNRIEEANNLYR